jgi:hypothetical protein
MSYKPAAGDVYYMLNSRFEVKQTTNTGSGKSSKRISVGNCFKTAAEAEDFRRYVLSRSTKKWWQVWR